MASTWSSLKFELIGTGEQAGTWGTTTNANLGDAIEQAIAGKADITMSSTSQTLTLTDTTALQDARALYLNLSGTPGGAATLNVPAVEKSYIVKNGTNQQVTVKVTGQTGVAVPVGATMILYDYGTDVVNAITNLPSGATVGGVAIGTGTGDVVGPASATDNAVVRFDGTTGKLVQNSVVTIADSTGDISGVGTLTASTKVVSPFFDAVGSAGGQLRSSGGTSQLAWGAAGDNLSLNVATNINPANANVSIAPTGTGTVTINPATAGTLNNIAIGGTTAAAGTFTTATATTGNITTVNSTTVDTTNLEVTNIKAKDGTAAGSIADSTGVVTITAAPVVSALTASQAVFTTAGKALVSNAITGTGNVVMSTSPTLVTPVLGTPTSGNLSNCTVDGTNSVGYRNLPAVGTKTTSYTLATGDVGKYVQVGSGGSITIPDATFAEGNAISIFNNTSGGITITCTITTAYIAGTDSDKASVTLATRGVATILFISGTVCVITGNVS